MKNNLKRLKKLKNKNKSKENKSLRHFKKESKPFKLSMNNQAKTKSKNTEKIKRTFYLTTQPQTRSYETLTSFDCFRIFV